MPRTGGSPGRAGIGSRGNLPPDRLLGFLLAAPPGLCGRRSGLLRFPFRRRAKTEENVCFLPGGVLSYMTEK